MTTLATSIVPVEVLLEAAASRRAEGKLDEARALYRMVLAAEPTHLVALRKGGEVELALGRPAEAASLLNQAVQADPDHAASHADFAVALARLGHVEQALASFDRAVALQPGAASILYNRGNLLAGLDRLEAAQADFQRAVSFLPTFAVAWARLAEVLRRRGDPAGALKSLARAAELAPTNSRIQAAYGDALYEAKDSAGAAAAYQRALALEPGQAGVWSNLGMCRLAMNKAPAALEALDRAVQLDPNLAAAHSNRGVVLRELLRVDEALESFERALALDPDHAAARANMGVCQLLVGRFAEGWRGHEARWKTGDGPGLARRFDAPLWLGQEDVAGKTILLHAEQGFGDTLHFCRYAPLLAARGARVVLEVQPALKSLMQSLEGVDTLLARGEPLPPFDLHCPLMSLPLAFGTDETNIPASPAYLKAPEQQLAVWRERLGPAQSLRVGVVWFGKPSQHNDHNRSVPLAEFVRALPQDVEVHSLLDRVREDEVELLAAHPQIRRHDAEIKDFADTAALATCMDLVVSVCTSTAHLSGALGRPTWILLPYSACWRWRLDREDSPWYPTARLFRQPALGDWRSVMDRVRPELERLSAARR